MHLNIAEQLLVLIISRKGKNRLDMGFKLTAALKRAVIEELMAEGFIEVEDSTFKFPTKEPTKDLLLDEMLQLLKSGKSPFQINIAQNIEFATQMLNRLVMKKVIERKKIVFIPNTRIKDTTTLMDIKSRLSTFTREGGTSNKKLAILVGLLHALKVLPTFFTREEIIKVADEIPDIITKMEVNFYLGYVERKKRMDRGNPDIDRLWQKAFLGYRQRKPDMFTSNAFPVFEKSLKHLHERHYDETDKDVRKMINDLYFDGHLKLDKEHLHWVWTMRNKRVHEGTVLSPKELRRLFHTVSPLVMECFKD
ncbi:MAG: GPP34 family phosphoprotein [Candidatus Hodarchaeota archaeon]